MADHSGVKQCEGCASPFVRNPKWSAAQWEASRFCSRPCYDLSRTPSDGACKGHRCDGCETCVAGGCCGDDVGDAHLPMQGSWPTPAFAPIGVLVEVNDLVVCHICGELFTFLGRHVRVTHKISTDEYRSYFGLACRRALCSSSLSQARSRAAKAAGLGVGMTPPTITSEQHSVLARRREQREEVRIIRRLAPRDPDTARWTLPPGRRLTSRRPTTLEGDV